MSRAATMKMNTIGKSILVGLLFGAALFLLPFFLLRLFLFFALLGLAFRLIRGRRPWGYAYGPGYAGPGHAWPGGYRGRGFGPRGGFAAFTDRIRQMSDDEYAQFKQRGPGHRFGGRCGQPAENATSATANWPDITSNPGTETTNA